MTIWLKEEVELESQLHFKKSSTKEYFRKVHKVFLLLKN